MKNILLILTFSAFAYTQTAEITNITTIQRTDGSQIVDVCYDLVGDANFSTFYVFPEVSLDGGSTYHPIWLVTGDIGSGVEAGLNRCFEWDFGSELDDLYTADAEIRLTGYSAIPTSSVTDIDGNTYTTAIIGGQEWMTENLRVTTFNTGEPIHTVYADGSGYSAYDNDPNNVDTYGYLYNENLLSLFHMAGDHKICMEDWHVATGESYNIENSTMDWNRLISYLSLSDYFNSISDWPNQLKSMGTIENGDGLWLSPNIGAANAFGFNALPGGRHKASTDEFERINDYGFYWADNPRLGVCWDPDGPAHLEECDPSIETPYAGSSLCGSGHCNVGGVADPGPFDKTYIKFTHQYETTNISTDPNHDNSYSVRCVKD